MSHDDDRSAILRRRALFVASALAGLSADGCRDNPPPQPCLSQIATPPDAGDTVTIPMPCLTPLPNPDAGEPTAPPVPSEEPDAGPPPQPCLSPPPHPCLSIAPPPQPPPHPCLTPLRRK